MISFCWISSSFRNLNDEFLLSLVFSACFLSAVVSLVFYEFIWLQLSADWTVGMSTQEVIQSGESLLPLEIASITRF